MSIAINHPVNFTFEVRILKMWKAYALICSILLLSIIVVDISDAQHAASASAAAASAGSYLDHQPEPQNPVIDSLAQLISDGLLHSQVFGDFANFDLKYPYNYFYLAGAKLLALAGIAEDPAIVKVVSDAVVEVASQLGSVSSKLYFDAIAYFLAEFLFDKGIANSDNVEYLALRIVTSIEAVACLDGLIDTQSVFDATVTGFFYVLDSYGLINYNSMVDIFYRFAAEIKTLAGIPSK